MGVFTGSRYASQPVLQVEDSWGTFHPTIYGPSPFVDTAFNHYVVRLGDRFDLLANQFLGDPTLWWRIADANPQIPYPDNPLQPGSVIRIPVT
jgi:nucleoid-associated protein YgaU